MNLNKLLALINIQSDDERIIEGISDDSRDLKANELFLCYDIKYLKHASSKNAITLSESKLSDYTCLDLKQASIILLKVYYGYLVDKMYIIGVCGSAGKGSVSSYLYHIYTYCKQKAMLIGTHFIQIDNHKYEINNTTPALACMMRYMKKAYDKHINILIMEVSSHGIDQKRIEALRYNQIIYTNIKQDHLDYHYTLVHYRFTKYKLRHYLKKQGMIILNSEEDFVAEFKAINHYPLIQIGIDHILTKQHYNLNGCSFNFDNHEYKLNTLGDFQIKNVALAITASLQNGFNHDEIINALSKYYDQIGRLQHIDHHDFDIFIDYAHTADALNKVLAFLSQQKSGRLICVVGCGGNREKQKRKAMASIACKYSDFAIFTSDNPRFENPDAIIDDMCEIEANNYLRIKNRYLAIKYAIDNAINSDIIIIAGKGDEKSQEINGVTYFFHDESAIRHFLKLREELIWK